MEDTPPTGPPKFTLGLPRVPLEQGVQKYYEKFNDSYLDNLFEKELKMGSSTFRNTFKKTALMIGGLSNLTDISIHYRLNFEHDYPEQEPDGDVDVGVGVDVDDSVLDPDIGGQAAVSTKRFRVLGLSDAEPRESTQQQQVLQNPPITMGFNSVVQAKPQDQSELVATLMKRMGMGPPDVGRLTPTELAQMIQKRTDGKHINIPKLQVELYEEFESAIEDAIEHAERKNTSNPNDQFKLLKELFVKIQKYIRDFYITATPNEPKYKNSFPVIYETYMRNTNHYFDFFRRCFKLAQKLRENGTQHENIPKVVQFLCRSVFIRLNDTQIEAVVKFIFELLSIADVVNATGLTDPERKPLIIEKLTPVIERIGKNKVFNDPLYTVFLSYITNDYAKYIWLQELILGRVIVSEEEFNRKKSKEGGIRKKVNHTNKSKQSRRRNKQKSKRNKQSRRNRQRS